MVKKAEKKLGFEIFDRKNLPLSLTREGRIYVEYLEDIIADEYMISKEFGIFDNNETYEVYREFRKKNPKIFDKNLEDVSKQFNIDKTKGNEFFYEQVGLEEEIFTSSIITKQAEVKLDEKMQNTLIQKISNILGTGEDTTSYTTIVNKLKKKLNDEVGTQNTKERPLNTKNLF